MNILRSPRKFWTLTGLYYDNEKNNVFDRLTGYLFGKLMVLYYVLVIIFSVLYLTKNCAQNITQVFKAIFQLSVCVATALTFMLLTFQKKNLAKLVKNIEEDVNIDGNANSFIPYENIERKCALITKWACLSCLLVYNGVYPIITISTWIYQVIRGHVDTSVWYNVYELW